MTGISTASHTCGTSAIVVRSPTCPPDSPPSAITAEAPRRATIFASATDGTTGITFTPAASQPSMYLEGLPAPVVTTAMRSSATTAATSSANGLISITFTPKGLSVLARHFSISARSCAAFEFIAAMMPSPPALDTAEASDALATHAMPP